MPDRHSTIITNNPASMFAVRMMCLRPEQSQHCRFAIRIRKIGALTATHHPRRTLPQIGTQHRIRTLIPASALHKTVIHPQPLASEIGPKAHAMANIGGNAIALQQGNTLATAFCPEITDAPASMSISRARIKPWMLLNEWIGIIRAAIDSNPHVYSPDNVRIPFMLGIDKQSNESVSMQVQGTVQPTCASDIHRAIEVRISITNFYIHCMQL